MELDLELPLRGSVRQVEPLRLRSVDAPMSGTLSTWAMDFSQEDLPIPTPSAHCRLMGFWNDIPEEEQRDVVELMPPTYGKKKYVSAEPMVVDVKEMATVLIGIYLLLALIHIVMMIVHL
jgi:hypothetical protein